MNREWVVAVLLWLALALFLGSMVRDCVRCELSGGLYVRSITGHHCMDPSTGKARP